MRRPLTIAAAVACLALVGAADASAQNQTPNQDYVAMGDSYSAGNGTGDYYETSCYRSNFAYGPLIDANYLPGSVTFAHPACSGARTNHIDQDSQNGFPKQVDLLGNNTDYVTITIGGNDAGFTSALTDCANPFGDCDGALDDAQDYIQNDLPALLDRNYASIRSNAPNAVVTVLGYPRIFKANSSCNLVFSAAEVNKANATADLLNDVMRQRVQAAGPGFAFVDSRAAWIGHGACDSTEWINGFSISDTSGSFHPNKSGYQAYAGMAASTLLAERRVGQTTGPNGRVAFASGRDGNSEIYTANANGSFPVDLTNDPGSDVDPAWSPDGTKLAFASNRDGDYEIYVINADGSGLTKLTSNTTFDDREPDWSPNGDYIAFRSNRTGNDEIFKMTAAGGSPVNLTNNSAADQAPDWSPDGSEIAFQRVIGGSNTDVYRMNSDGQGQLDLTPTPTANIDSQPTWSPDGNTVAFQSNRDGDFEIFTVARIAPPATPTVTPPSPVQRTTNTASDREPSYSPDGSRLTFTSDRDGNDEIYTATATGGSPQRITTQSAADTLPTWQGDKTAPQTTIDSGPSGSTTLTTPSFTFSSDEPGSSFECRIDGGSFSSCASPLTTDPLDLGSHTFEVRATDPSGNVDSTPASRTFTVAPPPGSTAITSGPTGTTNDPTPTFEFSSNDPGSTYECKVDDDAYAPCTSPHTTASLADGPHTFTVQGTDSHGTPDPEVASVSFTVDATAPETSLDLGPVSPTNDPHPSFQFSSGEGSATFECRLDGGSWESCSSPHQYGTSLTDGSHTFDVRALDAAGNADATPASTTFTVDTDAPQTTITSAAPDPADSTPTFTFDSDESGSTFECRIDDAPFGDCESPLTTPELADGPHAFEVRATDAAGNTDPSPASASFTIDATAPETTIDSGPGASDPGELIKDRTPTWTFSSDDLAADFECQLDSGPWDACDQSFTATSLTDGPHTFRVRATDAAANVDQTPAEVTFTVDATAPQTTITSGPAGGGRTNNATPDFGFSSSESGSSFECRLDGSGPGGWGSCTSPHTTASLSDGSHTFEVRATDAAGNTDATPASRTFTVDTTPPTTAITGAPPAHTNDTTPTFAFDSPSDGGASFECRLDGSGPGGWGSCTSPHTTASLSDGSHTFEVRATDAAGNTDATPAQATFTVDTVAPTTTIIGEPLSPGNDQTPSFTFASNEAGASFECSVDAGPFTSCSSPHELASLPAGQHSFDVRAVDQAGNTDATPEHRTFVIDLTPPDTRITSGPEGTLRATTATFAFSATEPGSTFQCRLDDGAFATCGGTTATFDGLAEGAHRFEVRAVDSAGNPDPTPAASEFTVDSRITGLSVSAARKQRTKPKKPRVIVLVSAGERVDVHAGGKLKPGKKSVALATSDATADAGSPLTLRLAPVASGARKVKKALKARKKVKATITVTVTDAGGNEQTTQLRVKLSR